MSATKPTTPPADLNSLVITVPAPLNDPPSVRPWVVAQPWDKLCDKYFSDGGFLSVEFDLYSARRAATDPGWRNRLEGADLMATGLMNSRMASRDVDAVLVNRPQIEEALRHIPADLHLADVDLTSEPLGTPLKALVGAFLCHRVNVAKTMKTLCQKRPRLLPMLDSQVRQALYFGDPWGMSRSGDEFAAEVLAEIDLFRRILLWGSETASANYPRLVRLADALADRIADEHGRHPDLVTPVRVLDDLLWFEWGGHEHYDWWENTDERRVERWVEG